MKKSMLGKVAVGLGVLLGIGGIALASTDQAEASTLYRAYNPNTGEHLYTQNGNEIPFVVRAGWRNEGTAWQAPSKGTPVYRMFNPNRGGDHHYTINTNEVNMLKSKGWRYEGESWKSGGSTPVYRLYNRNARSGAHHFTISAAERDNLKRHGWRYEGVAFYSGKDVSTPTPAPKPVENPKHNELVWTVWFDAYGTENSKYSIVSGSKTFNSEQEAKAYIDKYANDMIMSPEMVGSNSYGYKQIFKNEVK